MFEGEGTVGVYTKDKSASPRLSISQHERSQDVLVRCYEITNVGQVHGPYGKDSPAMFWSVGKIEDVYKVIKLIYPWLSERRQTQCDVVIDFIKSTKTYKRLNKDI